MNAQKNTHTDVQHFLLNDDMLGLFCGHTTISRSFSHFGNTVAMNAHQ